MKVLVCLVLMMSLSLFLSAQDISISMNPQYQFYNVLPASSFDFQNPANQPLFFTVTASNTTGQPIEEFYLTYSLSWNDEYLIDFETRARNLDPLAADIPLIFNNQDILNETGSRYFGRPNPSLTLTEIIDRIPNFRDVIINTGMLPDGIFIFVVRLVDANGQLLSNDDSMEIRVMNPGGIFLVSPGVSLGSTIPTVSSMPANFIWSSNLAASPLNPFRLIIKEFDDPSMLTPDYIETDGLTISDIDNLQSTYYSDYIPLQDGRYYAWQISTEIIDPTLSIPPEINSPYYVFRYEEDSSYDQEGAMNAIRMYLLSLNISWVTEMLNNGFDPSGIIDYNGTVWSGSGAENLIYELQNRQVIDVKLAD